MSDPTPSATELDRLLAPRAGRRKWPWLLAAPAAVAVLVAVVLGGGSDGSAPRFATAPVERGDLAAVVSATGNLEPTNQVDVGSELSGTVARVLADANDTVETGQVLVVLDTTKLSQQTEKSRAALLSARARVAQARATLDETGAGLARFEEVSRLSGGKVPSATELDGARAQRLRAEADLAAAQAAVAEAESTLRANENDLTKGAIRSPIDGVVLERAIEPGQTVAASFQSPILFTLAEDLARMELTVNVAEADVAQVQAGQPATFTVDAWPGKRFEATVSRVRFGSKVVENVVSYETELVVANDDLGLRPGMTATADIRVAERQDVLTVPNAALRFTPPATERSSGGFSLVPQRPRFGPPRGGGGERPATVYVLRDGEPVRVPVETGLTDGRRTEVRGEGLAEGTEVVLEIAGSEP